MRNPKLMIAMLAISQLSACTVMSKRECLGADWQRIGYAVGADGERPAAAAFLKRERVCAKHGANANRRQFMRGHEAGIEQFCNPYNAVLVGIDGRRSVIQDQICPESDYPGFAENFYVGYRLHELEQDVSRARSYVADLANRRASYYRRIRVLKERASEHTLSASDRRAINQQCDSLEYQARQLSHEISRHENIVYDLQRRARRYRSQLDEEYLDPMFEPASRLPSNLN